MTETIIGVLDKVNSPDDLKNLSTDELYKLSDEMRELIIKKVNTTGGHFGPNLGIVEATVALHYVFNSPVDKIVFDVSHQCYTLNTQDIQLPKKLTTICLKSVILLPQ